MSIKKKNNNNNFITIKVHYLCFKILSVELRQLELRQGLEKGTSTLLFVVLTSVMCYFVTSRAWHKSKCYIHSVVL